MWGLENQPVPLTVIEWINVLLRREELEYTLPDEAVPYEAAKINRVRTVWQMIHLLLRLALRRRRACTPT